MYLKGSQWSMQRKRKRSSPIRIVVLAVLVAGAIYINQVVVPVTPPLFVATPTPTRSPESYLADAQDAIKKGKINQAIATYQEAVKADPTNPALFITLARWQVLQNDLNGAKENVQNALLINPNHALAHAVNGWIMTKEKDYLPAEAELNLAIELDPNSALAYAYTAELYVDKMAQGQSDMNLMNKAIEFSKKARDLDPSLMEVHRVRGLVLENTSQSEEAIKEFEAAVQLMPTLGDLYVDLGRNYKLAGQYDKAKDVLMKAIQYRPDDPNPYAELAATYLTSGEFTLGAQIAGQAVQRAPKDPYLYGLQGTMYYKLAYAKEQLGSLDEAKLLYQQAMPLLTMAVKGGVNTKGERVDPLPLSPDDNSSIFYRLRYGLAKAKLGDCTETLQIVQDLRSGVPGNANVNDNTDTMLEICKQQVNGTATPEPTAANSKK